MRPRCPVQLRCNPGAAPMQRNVRHLARLLRSSFRFPAATNDLARLGFDGLPEPVGLGVLARLEGEGGMAR